jgi:flagellar basal body L-ring protein FlgH
MKKSILYLLPLIFSACSTFIHNDSDVVDYNQLAYGSRDNPSNSINSTESRQPIQSDDRNSSDPRFGSHSESDQNELDPSDEEESKMIDSQRGRSSPIYARGSRATRDDFIDHTPGDGSLWTGENDSNYFYSKNKVRAVGDIVTVKVEDDFIRQIGEEIKKSLTPAEQEVEMALYLKNNGAAKDDKDIEVYRKIANDDLKSEDAELVKERMEKAVRWAQVDVSKVLALKQNEEIRAEIIDRYPNGNYKIRSTRKILYRGTSKLVSMVGIAPAVDFDESDSIKTGKLYEYKIRVAR